ncbi:hypothetical protein WJX74_003266 [Apatococcus lobatus]|uniref:G-patch domain-containing protein n=1 Tax=Apatococcus lobatus TaxID=904363 RepID=A0AAW1QL61_9CHLO
MPRSKRSVSAAAAIKSFSRFFDGTGSGLSRNLPAAGFGDKDACSCAQCRRRSGPVTADTSMAVEEIYGLFADSDPDGGLVGAADDATDEDIQAKHKQLAEAAVNAVERGDEQRLRKVLDSVESDEELQADLASVLVIPVAQYGHSHLVTLLTDYGADLAETDPSRGGPPLMHAANNGHAGTVTALLRNGADPEGIDYNSQTALMVAIFSDRASAAEALLEGGAVVDTEDEKGRTALSHAAKYGSIDCLHILAQHNADVFHEDHDGRTPLEIADECGRAEAVLQLRRLQQRQKLRERREQRAKAAEDDRRNGLTEAERAVREAKAAKNMEALLQELDADAARAAAKQDTRRARRKAARLRGCHSELSNGHLDNGHHPLSPSSSASDVTASGLTSFPHEHDPLIPTQQPPHHQNGFIKENGQHSSGSPTRHTSRRRSPPLQTFEQEAASKAASKEAEAASKAAGDQGHTPSKPPLVSPQLQGPHGSQQKRSSRTHSPCRKTAALQDHAAAGQQQEWVTTADQPKAGRTRSAPHRDSHTAHEDGHQAAMPSETSACSHLLLRSSRHETVDKSHAEEAAVRDEAAAELRQQWDDLLARGSGCREVRGQTECIAAIKAAMPAMADAGMSVKYGKKVLGKLERAVEVHHHLQPDGLESMPLELLQDVVNKGKGVRGLLDSSLLDSAEAMLVCRLADAAENSAKLEALRLNPLTALSPPKALASAAANPAAASQKPPLQQPLTHHHHHHHQQQQQQQPLQPDGLRPRQPRPPPPPLHPHILPQRAPSWQGTPPPPQKPQLTASAPSWFPQGQVPSPQPPTGAPLLRAPPPPKPAPQWSQSIPPSQSSASFNSIQPHAHTQAPASPASNGWANLESLLNGGGRGLVGGDGSHVTAAPQVSWGAPAVTSAGFTSSSSLLGSHLIGSALGNGSHPTASTAPHIVGWAHQPTSSGHSPSQGNGNVQHSSSSSKTFLPYPSGGWLHKGLNPPNSSHMAASSGTSKRAADPGASCPFSMPFPTMQLAPPQLLSEASLLRSQPSHGTSYLDGWSPQSSRESQLLQGSSSPPASMFQNPWQPAMASVGLTDHLGLEGILPGFGSKQQAAVNGDHVSESECIVCLEKPKQTCCVGIQLPQLTNLTGNPYSGACSMTEAENFESALHEQLSQQQEALREVEEALLVEAGDSELLEIRSQLQEAVIEAEASLLELKRNRLLHQLACQPRQQQSPKGSCSHLCRFRYTDGQWYRGRVLSQADDIACVEFQYPTRAFMLEAKQEIPLASLQHSVGAESSSIGSAGERVLAADIASGLWLPAEIIQSASSEGCVQIVMTETGEHRAVQLREIIPVAAASGTRSVNVEEESCIAAAGPQSSSSEEEVDDASFHQQAAKLGAQTDTAHFANWESHTRGIGSKLMSGMGYKRNQGLGRSLTGSQAPLEVRLRKPGAGLGSDAGQIAPGTGSSGKKKRGGDRARKRKHAERTRAERAEAWREADAAEAEAGVPSMFSFINNTLGGGSEAAALKRRQHGAFATRSETPGTLHEPKTEPERSHSHPGPGDRQVGGGSKYFGGCATAKHSQPQKSLQDGRSILAQQEHVQALRQKVARLEEMGSRNVGDKVVASQVAYKLKLVRAELAAAEAAASASSQAVNAKDAQKKWLKF